MSGRGVVAIIALVVVVATVLQSADANLYKVGNASGWTFPPQNNPSLYTDWASKQTFKVGDVLEFAFKTGAHTVAQVSEAAYNRCDIASKPIRFWEDGPANVTLTSTGSLYFICTVATHCSMGQKLAIRISNSTGTPPGAPPPSRSPGIPSPPPSGSSLMPPPPPSKAAALSPPPPSKAPSSLAPAAVTFVVFGLVHYAVGLLHF